MWFQQNKFFIFIVLINASCQASSLINEDDFKQKVKLLSNAQHPAFFYGLCEHKFNHNYVDLKFFAPYLPKDWKSWSTIQQEQALNEIKGICLKEYQDAQKSPEQRVLIRIFQPPFESSRDSQKQRYLNFVRSLTHETRQAILDSGINMINPSKSNFIDFAALYPEIGLDICNDRNNFICLHMRNSATFSALGIQTMILNAIKELQALQLKEFNAAATFAHNHPRQLTTISQQINRMLGL